MKIVIAHNSKKKIVYVLLDCQDNERKKFMDLTVSAVSFGARRMSTKEVNDMLRANRTMPLNTKLPKNLERQISPNLFQRIGNFFSRIFS